MEHTTHTEHSASHHNEMHMTKKLFYIIVGGIAAAVFLQPIITILVLYILS